MATLNTRDPVQGLIDYVKDVKPFHTKILEVWVEYIYTDAVNGVVHDAMKMVVDIALDRREKFCKYGFDTQPWNDLLSGITFEETVPGDIEYNNGQTISKAIAYRLYFDYMQWNWKWIEGIGPQPIISSDPDSYFFYLSFPEILTVCKEYFAEIANSYQYWYEPSSQKLYKKLGNDWHEQSAYISTVHPPYPIEQDLWVSTSDDLLYVYLGGSWEEIYDVNFSYSTPKTGPKYPIDWLSNWDTPSCLPPFGENVAYTFVYDKLEFTHGSELFLLDKIRGMVFDPTGENNTLSNTPGEFTQRTEYPIKYRTSITQDPSGRFKIERAEVSILTEPGNPEIIGNPYTVYLDGMELEGFGLDRQRKGVRLNEFLVWRFKSETEGVQLMADDIINRDTFGYRVENGQLIAQKVISHATQHELGTPTATSGVSFVNPDVIEVPDDVTTFDVVVPLNADTHLERPEIIGVTVGGDSIIQVTRDDLLILELTLNNGTSETVVDVFLPTTTAIGDVVKITFDNTMAFTTTVVDSGILAAGKITTQLPMAVDGISVEVSAELVRSGTRLYNGYATVAIADGVAFAASYDRTAGSIEGGAATFTIDTNSPTMTPIQRTTLFSTTENGNTVPSPQFVFTDTNGGQVAVTSHSEWMSIPPLVTQFVAETTITPPYRGPVRPLELIVDGTAFLPVITLLDEQHNITTDPKAVAHHHYKFTITIANPRLYAFSVLDRRTPGRQDIDCPFNDGQVVYFTSSDDLPAYNLLTQESRRNVPLQRYVPYRIVKIDDRHFSVAILRLREKYDHQTGQRIPSTDLSHNGYKTTGNSMYEIDTQLMGQSPYLNFVTSGHGEMFFGIGHPVPFIEQRGAYSDGMSGRFREGLSSTTETFLGSKFVEIMDVLIAYNDGQAVRNGFVLEGDFPLQPNEIIRVANSSDSLNDGAWTVSGAKAWTNRWTGFTDNGTPIESTQPVWWNDIKMGEWPTPVKRPQKEIDELIQLGQYEDEYSEYYYYTVTTVGVSGVSPSTLYPHGAVVFDYYAFGEPSLAPNVASTVVSDKLQFGSFVLTQMPGGEWEMVPEPGVPGMSIDLKESINVQIQEQFAPNGYGIPTVGSYDIHYYDIHSYGGGVVEE